MNYHYTDALFKNASNELRAFDQDSVSHQISIALELFRPQILSFGMRTCLLCIAQQNERNAELCRVATSDDYSLVMLTC